MGKCILLVAGNVTCLFVDCAQIIARSEGQALIVSDMSVERSVLVSAVTRIEE